MISYLQGDVIIKEDDSIILNVRGVGYKIFCSRPTLDKIPENVQDIKLFCHLHVREGALDLYGFFTKAELELFDLVNDISGVGPKAALQISAIGSSEEFRKAVAENNEEFFAGVHGIGKKKIQKIILELTGKLERLEKRGTNGEEKETFDALVHLGFSRQSAREALSRIPKDARTLEEKIKAALKEQK